MPQAVIAFAGSYVGGLVAAELAIAGTLQFHAIKAAVAFGFSSVAGDVLGLGADDAPATGTNLKGIKINTTTSNFAIPVIYGRVKTGGNISLRDLASEDSDFLHTVLILGEGEVDEIVDVFFDDESMRTKDVFADHEITFPTGFNKVRLTISDTEYQGDTIAALVSEIQSDPSYSSFEWDVTAKDASTIRIYETTLGSQPNVKNMQFLHGGEWKSSYTVYSQDSDGDGGWGDDGGGWGDDSSSGFGGYSDAGGGFGV